MNYLVLNGKSSLYIQGLLISELPPVSKPQMRTQVDTVDGRDGDIVTDLGFQAYDREVLIGLTRNFDISTLRALQFSQMSPLFTINIRLFNKLIMRD